MFVWSLLRFFCIGLKASVCFMRVIVEFIWGCVGSEFVSLRVFLAFYVSFGVGSGFVQV